MAGQAIAANITPLNGMCTPSPTPGKIGLLSIGMCNAWLEFGGGAGKYPNDAFKKRAEGRFPLDHPDLAKSDNVVVINGAQAGATANDWAQENNACWTTAINKVTAAGLCPDQVRVVWMEHAVDDPSGDFQESEQALQGHLTNIAKNVLKKFPNCTMAFLSTRTRAFTTEFHNPEPYAYETGFANKLTIQAQTDRTDLCFDDPTHFYSCAPVVAPYIAWGPYSWVDGSTPRSDGKTWECSDLTDDFVHPTGCGVHKVADQLLAFFETSPLTTPWYLRPSTGNMTVTADYTECGNSPYKVQFCADVSGGTAPLRYSWDFDDGDYTYDNPTPTKSFPAPGTYKVHLTVVDDNGDHAQTTISITPP
jgi:PKD domain-containing protein